MQNRHKYHLPKRDNPKDTKDTKIRIKIFVPFVSLWFSSLPYLLIAITSIVDNDTATGDSLRICLIYIIRLSSPVVINNLVSILVHYLDAELVHTTATRSISI